MKTRDLWQLPAAFQLPTPDGSECSVIVVEDATAALTVVNGPLRGTGLRTSESRQGALQHLPLARREQGHRFGKVFFEMRCLLMSFERFFVVVHLEQKQLRGI